MYRSPPSRTWTSSIVIEQVVGGVAGEDVGQARVHARAQDRQATDGPPLVVLRELVVASSTPDLVEGVGRVRLGQADGHVEVVDAGLEGAVEDGRDEARVGGVHDQVDAVLARQRDDLRLVAGIDALDREAASGSGARVAAPDASLDPSGALEVVVGEDHRLDPWTLARDDGDRLADRADADQKDLERAHHALALRAPTDRSRGERSRRSV